MVSMERILFPVDLSEQSRKAAPFVKAMAKRFHSEVALLHVLEVPAAWYGPPEGVAWATLSENDRYRQERQAEFESFLVDEFTGIPVVRQSADGDPATQIDCYARTKNAGLIMMPTHGYGTFRRLLLGSVTAKVLHDAKCPVWTGVHEKGLASRDAVRCRRILCAVDTNPRDVHVIQWAMEFAGAFGPGAELRLIHAIPGAEMGVRSDACFREFLFKVAREEMGKLLDQAGILLEAAFHGGKPDRVVRDAALDQDADLIVIGRGADHAFGRLRDNAYAIIREAPCPVISV